MRHSKLAFCVPCAVQDQLRRNTDGNFIRRLCLDRQTDGRMDAPQRRLLNAVLRQKGVGRRDFFRLPMQPM